MVDRTHETFEWTQPDALAIPQTIHFGKFKGWPISEICNDEKYLRWLLENDMVRLGIALAGQPGVRDLIRTEVA